MVDMPKSNTSLTLIPIICELYVVRFGSKKVHQNIVTCLEEVGVFGQNILTNTIWGGGHDV
jgi:hypothetical protein